jgi:hypothetical protein
MWPRLMRWQPLEKQQKAERSLAIELQDSSVTPIGVVATDD